MLMLIILLFQFFRPYVKEKTQIQQFQQNLRGLIAIFYTFKA